MGTMRRDQERLKTLLQESITVLCKNGLFYNEELCVEGLLGITLDNEQVFLVSIKETFKTTRVSTSDADHHDNRVMARPKRAVQETPAGQTGRNDSFSGGMTSRISRSPDKLDTNRKRKRIHDTSLSAMGDQPPRKTFSTTRDSELQDSGYLLLDPMNSATDNSNFVEVERTVRETSAFRHKNIPNSSQSHIMHSDPSTPSQSTSSHDNSDLNGMVVAVKNELHDNDTYGAPYDNQSHSGSQAESSLNRGDASYTASSKMLLTATNVAGHLAADAAPIQWTATPSSHAKPIPELRPVLETQLRPGLHLSTDGDTVSDPGTLYTQWGHLNMAVPNSSETHYPSSASPQLAPLTFSSHEDWLVAMMGDKDDPSDPALERAKPIAGQTIPLVEGLPVHINKKHIDLILLNCKGNSNPTKLLLELLNYYYSEDQLVKRTVRAGRTADPNKKPLNQSIVRAIQVFISHYSMEQGHPMTNTQIYKVMSNRITTCVRAMNNRASKQRDRDRDLTLHLYPGEETEQDNTGDLEDNKETDEGSTEVSSYNACEESGGDMNYQNTEEDDRESQDS